MQVTLNYNSNNLQKKNVSSESAMKSSINDIGQLCCNHSDYNYHSLPTATSIVQYTMLQRSATAISDKILPRQTVARTVRRRYLLHATLLQSTYSPGIIRWASFKRDVNSLALLVTRVLLHHSRYIRAIHCEYISVSHRSIPLGRCYCSSAAETVPNSELLSRVKT